MSALLHLLNGLLVWSEATERKYRDCTQRSYLMLLVFAGLATEWFKLGVYTGAEGERFEDNEGLPESQQEQGLIGYSRCDTASLRLYTVKAHDLAERDLPAALLETGRAYILTGQGAGLPSGYRGPHSVTFVPLGDGTLAVLDPLARMRSRAVVATVDAILAWHHRLPTDIRWLAADELRGVLMGRNFTLQPGLVRIAIKADLPHVGVPIDGRVGAGTWPPLKAGDAYVGTPITLDVPVAGGLKGEDRRHATLVMVGPVACAVLDKDVTRETIDGSALPHSYAVTRDDGIQVAQFGG